MMQMLDYVKEIEFASSNLIPVIWGERDRLRQLESELESLTRVARENYRRAEFVAMNAEDPEDAAMATGMFWDNYFGEDKERYYKDKDREKVIEQIASHALSIGSLAGSLLQYAKQGISLAHGSLGACPHGRAIGTQFLKDVIWQGRNQAIHWEEGNPHANVQRCFDKLTTEIDPKFADHRIRNLAVDIIELLSWTDFPSFKADLLSLA